ncbi:hypothetical protein E2C01_058433 [Portunus trituberculatus]|uniref:Uncharacterized protein n=1 Tax=Portunus trituberculatus TaxID=210409 RepID=A0A5B7GVJ8_PORTR|nr:hypothetical protein [Portunus trituberculatus]
MLMCQDLDSEGPEDIHPEYPVYPDKPFKTISDVLTVLFSHSSDSCRACPILSCRLLTQVMYAERSLVCVYVGYRR